MTEGKKLELVKLNNVRISFPSLFRPRDWKNGKDPKYEVTFMLDKTRHLKEINHIQDQIDEILTEKKIKRPVPESFKICLKDGDLSDREELAGHYYIIAKSLDKVPLLDKDPKIEVTDEKRFYGGCYVSAYIQLAPFHNTGKGITAYLKSVQFRKDGERFGSMGIHDVSTAYDPVEEDIPDDSEDLF